jgi:hypothetical protein
MSAEAGAPVWTHVWWSIYVKTSNLRKLREAHLPPIEAALEAKEFDWDITVEDESQGLFRLVTFQNFSTDAVEAVVIPVLRRAYRLASPWTIGGLDDLTTGSVRHVSGSCHKPPLGPKPPALERLMFEIEPGRILPMKEDGGWPVVDRGPEPAVVKPGQIRWPKPPEQGSR